MSGPVGADNDKKFCVWLCWRGWWPLTTHWRGPTTDSHGDSWLLSFPPGPVRPSLVNLTPPGSPGGSMLMQALVRTPDQHESVTNRNPLLKPSNRTCLQVAGLQERATAPGWDILNIYRSCSSVSPCPGDSRDSRPGSLRRPGTTLAFSLFPTNTTHELRFQRPAGTLRMTDDKT